MLDRKIFSVFSETADLRPHTQQQLLQVYTTLATVVMSSMAGCFVAGRIPALGDHGLLALLGVVAGTVAVFVMRPSKENMHKRRMILWTVAWLIGSLMQPIVDGFFLQGDQDIVYMALGTSGTLFASFAAATMMTPRRRTIYLVGTAIAGLVSLSWISLLAYFYPTRMLHSMTMLVSLAASCLSVVIHTHGILELARAGADLDPVVHALTLFSDLAELFVRLLVLFSNDKRERERKAARSSSSSSSSSAKGRRYSGKGRSTAVPVGNSGASWSWNL
ncbi:Inhibitor of apoptosis-promoting Bax1-related protein [Coemansia sp. IMI 209127]|nr:Inhibitor of apoptosis-promoting Bax1-related protein [Coemansia sp. IMI 209127]